MNEPATETRIQRKNRMLILDAALEVFSAHGFRGTTLDQIAQTAGLSKPNLLYYFPTKEAIHLELLSGLVDTWLDPLRAIDPDGDPVEEILSYVHTKLKMSREMPRESRLFANEILHGAPMILPNLEGELRPLVNEKAVLVKAWADDGKIAPVDGRHLIFSIWSLTQHYADFEVQIGAILDGIDPFPGAETYLDHLFRRLLAPE